LKKKGHVILAQMGQFYVAVYRCDEPIQGPQIVALFWYDGGSNGPRIVVPSGRET